MNKGAKNQVEPYRITDRIFHKVDTIGAVAMDRWDRLIILKKGALVVCCMEAARQGKGDYIEVYNQLFRDRLDELEKRLIMKPRQEVRRVCSSYVEIKDDPATRFRQFQRIENRLDEIMQQAGIEYEIDE